MTFSYLPDRDRKHKRGWRGTEPTFVTGPGGETIGKCPHGMTNELCTRLVNDGIPFFPRRWSHTYPKRIYNIYEGNLYRATPTVPGRSYHGFPELPREAKRLPGELKRRILERAEAEGCLEQVRRCLSG